MQTTMPSRPSGKAIGPSSSAAWRRLPPRAAQQSPSGRCTSCGNDKGARAGGRPAWNCTAAWRFRWPALRFALVAVPLGAQPRVAAAEQRAWRSLAVILDCRLLLAIRNGSAARHAAPGRDGIMDGQRAVLFAMGLTLSPRMEQFRGENRWFRPVFYFQSRRRLLRRRTCASSRQGLTANGWQMARRASQENPSAVQRKFPTTAGHLSVAAFLFLFCAAHGGVCLSI